MADQQNSRHEYSDQRLSQIATMWSVVQRAHGSTTSDARFAREQLINRYGSAIRRYLLAALRDVDLADETFQDFSLQLVEGRFQIADPERGRFRNFLKTILFRLVANVHRKRQRDRLVSHDQSHEAVDDAQDAAAFDDSWRNQLLAAAWESLRQQQLATGKPVYDILKARVENPDASAAELAQQISALISRPVTESHFRVQLHRAREAFSSRLLDEVVNSLNSDEITLVEGELAELRLLEYCRTAFDRWKKVE